MIKKALEFYLKYYYRLSLDLTKVGRADYMQKFNRTLPDKLQFKILEAKDIRYFLKMDIKDSYRKILNNRFSNPEHYLCFAIIDTTKDVLAYYCWTNSLKEYYHNEFEFVYRHDGEKVLFENDFTVPEYRQMGLHSYCMLQRILHAQQAGFKKAIINIYFRNEPALKTAMKFGFRKTWMFPISIRKGSLSYTYHKLFNRGE